MSRQQKHVCTESTVLKELKKKNPKKKKAAELKLFKMINVPHVSTNLSRHLYLKIIGFSVSAIDMGSTPII